MIFMKLSTKSRYGTRILLELARRSGGEPVQISEISAQQNIPVRYSEQIILTLKKAKLVTSVRGVRGGHILAEKPDRISLGSIVRLFEGQSDLVECIRTPNVCKMADDCRVRLAWKEATDALYKKLDAITIADLLCEPSAVVESSRKVRDNRR